MATWKSCSAEAMEESILTAAVIGLGQAGSRFDEEPRPAIWSHTGAYLALPKLFRLAAGADIDDGNRRRFADRCPQAEVFDDAATLFERIAPDVVSICTPPRGRADLVEALVSVHRPRALICEKPLEIDAAGRQRLVEACANAGVKLLVNYNRRYASVFRKAREAILDGRLGALTSITVTAPNRLWSVGSHAVNLLLYLAGETPEDWHAFPLPSLDEGGEPACDMVCRFPSGVAGRVLTAGYKETAIFEADIIGRLGRIGITGMEAQARFTPLEQSSAYVGYRVQGESVVTHPAITNESTFETIAREAAEVARGTAEASSTGNDAMASEGIVDAMARACDPMMAS